MSHDIYFAPPDAGRRFNPGAFAAYVEVHPRLGWREPQDGVEQHDNTAPSEAEYRHPNTEVTFTYERFEATSDRGRWPLVLTIEYAKPHVFGLEAAQEIARFAGHFGLHVIDPQRDASQPSPFDAEQFLATYEAGNRAGYTVQLERTKADDAPVRTLPTETLERTWRWNSEIEDDAEPFAPCVSYVELFGVPQVAVMWPETPEFILPEVDLIVVWRGRNRKPRVAPMTELREVLKSEPRVNHALDGWHVTARAELAHAVEQLPLYDGPLEYLDLGEILNHEWC